MNPEWLQWLVELPPMADILVKVTVLLTLGWMGHFTLRRANPRWRVLLWRGVAVGLIIVPLLTVSLPKWRVPVVPAREVPPPVFAAAEDFTPAASAVAPFPASAPMPGPLPVSSPEPIVTTTPEPGPVESRPHFSFAGWASEHAAALGVGAWLAAAMAFAARFLVGWRRVRRMVGCTTAAPGSLQDNCRNIARVLGIIRPVEVRLSEEISSPFLTGLRRPVLILPGKMAEPGYSRELRGILAHELSHLRSNDLFWRYVLQWLSLILWFHPLVWRMRAAHASACEEVSDAVTAHFIGDAKAYSRTLARVALDIISRPPAFGGIPMARVSEISRRLKALKRRVSSTPLGRTAVMASLFSGLLGISLLSGFGIAYTKGEANQTGVGKNQPKITAPVWEALRGLNTGPLLLGMPQRLVKAIAPSDRTGNLWVRKPSGTDVEMNIRVEGGIRGEIFVGFFGDVSWSDLRAVRAFKAPGEHLLKDLPPGRYYVGAMIGDLPKLRAPGAHWNPPEQVVIQEGGTVRIETIGRAPELLRALGVERNWPQAVDIKKGQMTRIELLLSADFARRAVPVGPSYVGSSFGFWPEMDEGNMLKGRVTDSTGKPVPFALIQIREYNPGARSIAAPDVVADGNGFFCYDKMEWPYQVSSLFYENLPDRIGTRSRLKPISQVFEGKQEVDIQLDPFPTGTSTLRGKALDHRGRPLTRFVLWVRKEGPPTSLPDGNPWAGSVASWRIPYICDDGGFELTGLPTGTLTVNAITMESGAYEFGQQISVEFTEGKATDVQIVKRANRAFYGRALFEDGAAVYPGSAWPEDPAKGGAKRLHGGTRIRATGMFVLYVPDEEMDANDLKSKMAVIKWTGSDQILRDVGRFPLSQLSEDPDEVPVLKCERPDSPSANPDGNSRVELDEAPASLRTEPPNPPAEKPAEARGRIRGVIVNAGTGEPVAGAQVAIGHHLSDNDVKRIREQGAEGGSLQLTTETDEEGRFVMEDVAFWDYHLFSVKRSGFVPHEEWVALAKNKPEVEVRVNLKPAATIKVKVLNAEGMPMLGQIVRIESKDGHTLLPARGDWRPPLPYRTETAKMGLCSFEELPPGIYSVEAMLSGASEMTHHGAIFTDSLRGGETKEVELKAVKTGSLVKVKIEKDPHMLPRWNAIVVMSRHPGVLAWAGRNCYHPEDDRLGRVIQYMVNRRTADSPGDFRGAFVTSDSPYTFRNFPPGNYAILVISWGNYEWNNEKYQNAVCIRGARVDLSAGKEETIEMPWVEPEGPSPFNPRLLSNQVKLEAREYGAQELCDLISATAKGENVSGSEPQIIADSSIRDNKVEFPNLEMSLWNLVETIYLEKGWRLAGDFRNKRLVLRPTASAPVKKEEPRTRGQIRGVVVNAATGEPLPGAYVAVDHSGDAGGTNLGRFREQGIYATTETDESGRFVLDGVAFRDDHPFMATHPGFVRHQQTLALYQSKPDIDVRVSLRPAATIVAKVVDAEGKPLKEKAILRLEAEDGRPFFPMRADWPDLPYRMEATNDGTFSFGELDTGVYSIEVMRLGNMETTYHSKVSSIALGAGETKEALLKPADHRSAVKIKIEKDPHATIGETKGAAALLISPNPALLAWANRNFHHPEDERLGRIWKSAIIMAMMLPIEDAETLRELEDKARLEPPPKEGHVNFFLGSRDMTYTLRNFPPGEYAAFTYGMGMYKDWKSPAVYMRGVKAVFSPGKELTVEIPYVEPIGPSPTNTRIFRNQVTMKGREYTAQEICDLLIEETGAKPGDLVADSSIEDEKVSLPAAELEIWNLLETIYLKKGWTLEADYQQRKVFLRPSASSKP